MSLYSLEINFSLIAHLFWEMMVSSTKQLEWTEKSTISYLIKKIIKFLERMKKKHGVDEIKLRFLEGMLFFKVIDDYIPIINQTYTFLLIISE